MTRVAELVLLTGVMSLLAVSIATAQYSDRRPRNGACFYKDADFVGASVCVDGGDRVGSLPRSVRNEVSSIRIFGNAEVIVYDHTDFGGKSERFSSDVRNLDRYGWNDKVSAVEVRGRGFGGGSRPPYGGADPDVIVRRAYQDLLGRDPDQEGLRSYRRRIIDDGWSEQDVRNSIRESPEYREKTTMTYPKAQEIVRRAYLSVLGREPDPASRGYVDRVMRDKWTQQDVERELRKSPEYRARPR